MGAKKEEVYICVCDRCGEVYDNGDCIPSFTETWEADNAIREEEDWHEDGGKYYCPECFTVDEETDEVTIKQVNNNSK